ncbi:hypothetical protein [Floridanema evergladense]|uniref:LAGLIDADG homing endonuclease n=1 Tax=Floridaenema evergladense BLCC-F167 TaxID=3153639 RepID=A0ABV4WCX3_9CYAN
MPELQFTHIADHEELEAIFRQHIDKFKAGTLTAEELENLKTWCCLGFQLKGEIATDQWVKIYKFKDRLEGIFRVTKTHKEVTPFKKKVLDLVKEIWE